MSIVAENISALASFIGSLTVVGSALLWIYNKFIGEPRERKREKEEAKRQEKMLDLITERNKPLNESIRSLNQLLKESQNDRKVLHEIADTHDDKINENAECIDDHNERIIVLETKNGVRTYKEKYKGDEE